MFEWDDFLPHHYGVADADGMAQPACGVSMVNHWVCIMGSTVGVDCADCLEVVARKPALA